MQYNKLSLLNCPIDNVKAEEVLTIIIGKISTYESLHICPINVATCINALRNNDYLEKIKLFNLSISDGVWIIIGAKILGMNIKAQVRTPDLARNILRLCVDRNYKIYFLGAKKEILARCINNIKKEYQDLKIVGYNDGYFSLDKEDIIVNNINKSGADVLLIGLPSPRKEDFVINNIGKLKPIVSLGVGGWFDIVGGKTKEAPIIVQRIGMEWFYRLIQEPRRLWKRYLITNTVFIYLLFKEKVKIFIQRFFL